MSELGKFGKLIGEKHPRDRRRTDSEPLRATPAKPPRRKVAKPYGYSVEVCWPWEKEWTTVERWYTTKRARDQAMRAEQRRTRDWNWYGDVKPIERATDPTNEEQS